MSGLGDAAIRGLMRGLGGPAPHPPAAPGRQPVHVVYGGAHLYRADSVPRLGRVAREALGRWAPTPADFVRVFGMDPALAAVVHPRVVAKLEREPVEDQRIDFEDGYGHRPDAEEDAAAAAAAEAVARGMAEGLLPPFLGIRVKPLSAELGERALRTLDRFFVTLASAAGRVPPGFVVTLAKVTDVAQVRVLVAALDRLEAGLGLGRVGVELMVETPEALCDREGRVPLRGWIEAGAGRVRGLHFGAYDHTAALGITAGAQRLGHPANDLARQLMQLAAAGTGVALADGATTRLPVPVHRGEGLSAAAIAENAAVVEGAWRAHHDDVARSLDAGFYQGWDLHPAQLVSRYAATFAFFAGSAGAATARLRHFLDAAARATLVREVFDDAATGQGLLNHFLRGIACGAVTEAEAAAAGLTVAELHTRSFLTIVRGRRA